MACRERESVCGRNRQRQIIETRTQTFDFCNSAL